MTVGEAKAGHSVDIETFRAVSRVFVRCRNHRITEHVVIGTHGTLKHWFSKRMLSFRSMRILVFDEADEMLKVT